MHIKNSVILVTGGAGFIGSHIVDQLAVYKPTRIIVFDDFSRGVLRNLYSHRNSPIVQIVKGDIRDTQKLHDVMKGVDYVFHEAAIRITRCKQDPRACQEVIVDGTFNVLEACIAAHVKKIILASSAEVYGTPSHLPINEDHQLNNSTAYGAGKIAGEQMTCAFHAMYGLPYIILRYFNVYGPRTDIYSDYKEVLIKWLDAIDNGERPVIYGTGNQSLDFVYVEDVARANILALESALIEGVFNIGTGTMISLTELLALLLRLKKNSVVPRFEKEVKRPYVQRRRADTILAKKKLKFSAETPLTTGLKKLISWRESERALNIQS